MFASTNECHDRAEQARTAAVDSTEAGAEDMADTATRRGDAASRGGNATSDRSRNALDGIPDRAADHSEALTEPPNRSKRQAHSAHEGTGQPRPHGSDGTTRTRSQPLEPRADLPGDGDDRTSHQAEQMSDAPHRRANRT